METPRPPMADIFISYASIDRPVARRLADALEECGWSVWWDHRNLRGGQHFDRVIEEAVGDARVVIVVWSKASVESGWVRDEATLALEEHKLVPLRIDTARLPMRFQNIHTIDLTIWTGETDAEPFQRFVEDLTHYLGPPTPSDRSEHPGIPAAPHPRTAAPVGENQQPAGAAPITEHSQASLSGGSPHVLHARITTTQSTSTTSPTPAGRSQAYGQIPCRCRGNRGHSLGRGHSEGQTTSTDQSACGGNRFETTGPQATGSTSRRRCCKGGLRPRRLYNRSELRICLQASGAAFLGL
jgi:hypothetical protein